MIRILHLSDFHFKKDMKFDHSQTQRALIEFLNRYESDIDGIAITGDVAFSGQKAEYAIASDFFDKLLEVSKVKSDCVAICPGNHDVDRNKVQDLSRTLSSVEDSDRYFASKNDCLHIREGQGAFAEWYEELLGRKFGKENAVSGGVTVKKNEVTVNLLEVNTAIFCRDDSDHGNLWVGRSSLDNDSIEKTEINLALTHHPVDWLADIDATPVRAFFANNFDLHLRGHLHRQDYEISERTTGQTLSIASGAMYQGTERPRGFNILCFDGPSVEVFPYCYVEDPQPAWIPDNSRFGVDGETSKKFLLHRKNSQNLPQSVVTAKSFPKATPFSSDSLIVSGGEPIFVMPRICDRPFTSVMLGEIKVTEFDLVHLLNSHPQIQFEVEIEHGGTVLAEFAKQQFEQRGIAAEIFRAADIPNYEAKFTKFIEESYAKNSKKALIIDGFVSSDHKRMIELVVQKKEEFENLVVISKGSRSSSFGEAHAGSGEAHAGSIFDEQMYYVWPLDRSRLREVAVQIFNPQFEDEVHGAVEKTYSDLLALAIPITPANAIMYLLILKAEGDFVPLDRVSIIQKFVSESLHRASDQTTTSFGLRDKIDLLSKFVFDCYIRGKTTFSAKDWKEFCASYMDTEFVEFDHEDILSQLKASRLISASGTRHYLRYAFLYDFLVGMTAASSPATLESFLSGGHHRRLSKVVEVIAALAPDAAPLLRLMRLRSCASCSTILTINCRNLAQNIWRSRLTRWR